jgi:hypothetical protein
LNAEPFSKKCLRIPRVRFTLRTMTVAVAVVAVVVVWSHDWSGRRDRSYEIASRHASLSAEYRRNAKGDQGMFRIADWHKHMKRTFEEAANRPWEPLPRNLPFPPRGW